MLEYQETLRSMELSCVVVGCLYDELGMKKNVKGSRLNLF